MAKINWFPGHMAKSLKELKKQAARCNYFVECCDARLPQTSRNQEFAQLAQGQKGLILLTKADLADPKATEAWLNYFESLGHRKALAVNLLEPGQVKRIRAQIISDNQDIIQKARAKGRLVKPIRVMINGIPNTGKSSLINSLCGKKSAQVANRPGVTRSVTWLRAGHELELLDTPGILWPRLETVGQQLKLAISGAIKDDLLPSLELACGLIMILSQLYPGDLAENYNLVSSGPLTTWLESYQALEEIALAENLIKRGGQADPDRAANRLINAYRQARLGLYNLEKAGLDLKLPDSL